MAKSAVVWSNILGCFCGMMILRIAIKPIAYIVKFLTSIPLMRPMMLGMGEIETVLVYSLLISGALANFAANFICKPNKKGKKIGMVILAVFMAFYVVMIPSAFSVAGFMCAISLTVVIFSMVGLAAYAGLTNSLEDTGPQLEPLLDVVEESENSKSDIPSV